MPFKKSYEKTAMGLLSYLPDFKNLNNLKDEIHLNEIDPAFELYLYRVKDSNIVGVIGIQVNGHFLIIRYLSLAPGFREDKYEAAMLNELAENEPKEKITAVPDYTYLLRLIGKKNG